MNDPVQYVPTELWLLIIKYIADKSSLLALRATCTTLNLIITYELREFSSIKEIDPRILTLFYNLTRCNTPVKIVVADDFNLLPKGISLKLRMELSMREHWLNYITSLSLDDRKHIIQDIWIDVESHHIYYMGFDQEILYLYYSSIVSTIHEVKNKFTNLSICCPDYDFMTILRNFPGNSSYTIITEQLTDCTLPIFHSHIYHREFSPKNLELKCKRTDYKHFATDLKIREILSISTDLCPIIVKLPTNYETQITFGFPVDAHVALRILEKFSAIRSLIVVFESRDGGIINPVLKHATCEVIWYDPNTDKLLPHK